MTDSDHVYTTPIFGDGIVYYQNTAYGIDNAAIDVLQTT